MIIEDKRLTEWRRFADPAGGFQEEFLQPEVEGNKLLATLSRPLGESRPVGWVICHSFGIEQIHLGRLEVTAARDLAAAGYPVLRYSGRGYGDSEASAWDVTLDSHVQDATEMVALMRGLERVEAVGLIGVRFGGMVAGIVADRTGSQYLVAYEAIMDAGRFMSQLVRSGAMSAIVGKKATHRPVKEIKESLLTQGWADLGGLALTRECFEGMQGVRLIDAMRRFSGNALLISVNTTGTLGAEPVRLAQHIESLGGSCKVTALKHLTVFGRFQYGEGPANAVHKVDTLHELSQRLSEQTVSWCRSVTES
jgi:pimeloyl-ACP methyl ester carboxylesterase